MHVPLFGWLTWVAGRFLRAYDWSGWRATAVLIVGAAMLATGTEYLQHLFGRQPDWKDVARSLAGTAGACALLQAARLRGFSRASLLLVALFCILGSANALLQRAMLLHQKSSVFPVLEDFEAADSLSLWSLEHHGAPQLMLRVQQADGKWHLEMPLAKIGFSSLRYDAQSRDWTPYQRLILHYRLEGAPALHLGVRLDGGAHGDQRHYLESHLTSGTHVATISLPSDQQEKSVILSEVRAMTLFSSGSMEGTLAIEELRLE